MAFKLKPLVTEVYAGRGNVRKIAAVAVQGDADRPYYELLTAGQARMLARRLLHAAARSERRTQRLRAKLKALRA